MTTTDQPTLDSLLPAPGADGKGAAAAILEEARALFARLDALDEDERIDTINELRLDLHEHSPLKEQPIDCVLWVHADDVAGNEYNPNVVAAPEMDLLALSIRSDGYTQPVVTWTRTEDTPHEVVDGFHRHLVGKTDQAVRAAVHGRLPVTVLGRHRTDKADRMASTVRHNRARGQHTVNGMSDLVVEIARLRKPDEWIAEHLGMDSDEVRRLRQISGIAELFASGEFSEAWETGTDIFAAAPDDTEESGQ
ncbi:ParB/RepB/Spo0J family partition protein [Streptomyces sp. NPDC053720]|uniref:IbrB-like domain-containing protein n=1 Tax=Streptomyces sp. NPDC053720 TaxID=3154855 RepID=UPI00344218E0